MKVKAKLRKAPATKPGPRRVKKPPSRAARMLALAYYLERLIERGELKDYADAARRLRLTRARVTQVMNLLNLASGVQEALLDTSVLVAERRLRAILRKPAWPEQERLLGDR